MDKVCNACGQVEDVPEYDHKLWDIYHRLPDMVSRSHIEPLVYTQSDFEEMGYSGMHEMDEDTHDSVMMSMERNMVERGLCGGCGRPNLAGRDLSELMTEEEARDLHDMYAEMAAERRAGC
jgi:hypothetical protein